jgi:hypothetical protein
MRLIFVYVCLMPVPDLTYTRWCLACMCGRCVPFGLHTLLLYGFLGREQVDVLFVDDGDQHLQLDGTRRSTCVPRNVANLASKV